MKRFVVSTLLLIGTLALPGQGSADSASEHVDWGRWSFDYEVRDNTGLALRNVSYGGELVLSKASMPVLRVKYVKERVWWNPFTWFGSRADSGRCGPFQDRLRWQDLVPIVNCGDNKLCIESSTYKGIKWLELGIYARIGEYHIYQSWHLSDDGELRPVVQSRGLSCNTDHVHHPYWRFDFDINGNGMDQVFVRDEGGKTRAGGRDGTNIRMSVTM